MDWENLNYINEKMNIAMSHFFLSSIAADYQRILDEKLIARLHDEINSNNESAETLVNRMYDNWSNDYPFEIVVRVIPLIEEIINNNQTIDSLEASLKASIQQYTEAANELANKWNNDYVKPTTFDNLYQQLLSDSKNKSLKAEFYFTQEKANCLTEMLKTIDKFTSQVELAASEHELSMKKGYLEAAEMDYHNYNETSQRCKKAFSNHTVIDQEFYPVLTQRYVDYKNAFEKSQEIAIELSGSINTIIE